MSQLCTMAFGKRYARQALYLVADLAEFGTTIVVLTDHPAVFRRCRNVIVVDHRPEKFSYHLKRVALKEAMKHGDSATFIDADCIIRPGVPSEIVKSALSHQFSPGFHCWKTSTMSQAGPYVYPEIESFATEKGIPFDRDKITCQEMLFNLTAERGKEALFFEYWDMMASDPYLATMPIRHPVHGGTGEGTCMGIASCGAALTLHGESEMNASMTSKIFWHCALDVRKRHLHRLMHAVRQAAGLKGVPDLNVSAL